MTPLFNRVWVRIPGTRPKRYKRGWKRTAFPTASHYSPNFTRVELDCHCGCRTPPSIVSELANLAADLERLRAELGHSLGILSGYRCPAQNKKVGGAVASQHLRGKAADLSVPKGLQDRYVAAAVTVPAFRGGGVGEYPGGAVHVDRRGTFARWTSWVGS